MTFDWQNLMVVALVAAALVYLAMRLRRSLKGDKMPGCGGCAQCDGKPLATIDTDAVNGANKP